MKLQESCLTRLLTVSLARTPSPGPARLEKAPAPGHPLPQGGEGRTAAWFSANTLRLLIIVLAVAPVARAAGLADCHLVAGWDERGVRRNYTPDNLFEYLDGSAEGYILYGLVQMQGVT